MKTPTSDMHGRQAPTGGHAAQPTDISTVSPYLRWCEAAAYLRISKRTLSNWVREGRLGYAKVSRNNVLFRRRELDRFVEEEWIEAISVN